MSQSVLLLSPDPSVKDLLQAGLRPHEVSVRWSERPVEVLRQQEGPSAKREGRSSVIVIDLDLSSDRYPGWGAQCAVLERCFAAMTAAGAHVVLLSARHRPGDLLELLELDGLSHLVSGVVADGAQELVFVVRRCLNLARTESPVSLVGEQRVERRTVSCNKDRDRLLDELGAHLTGRGVSSLALEAAHAVADELIINAVYNAPVDEAGRHRYRHRDRRESVQLSDAESASFFFTASDEYVTVGIRDPFGSLKEETVRQYLLRAARGGQAQIEAKKGGAGLGLYVIFRNAHKLFITISPGEFTELVVVFKVSGGRRSFLTCNKSLHMITLGSL